MDWDTLLCEDRIRSFVRKAGASDLRSEFEKDYHRIIGSASFRRLQDKTQVFPLDRSDFIRTRLTHSLEVSSFAKSLGQNISESIRKNVKDETFTLEHKAAICDILQCAGLIHDIGNPPFGHFGETAIKEWFKKNLDRLEFEGAPGISRIKRWDISMRTERIFRMWKCRRGPMECGIRWRLFWRRRMISLTARQILRTR